MKRLADMPEAIPDDYAWDLDFGPRPTPGPVRWRSRRDADKWAMGWQRPDGKVVRWVRRLEDGHANG